LAFGRSGPHRILSVRHAAWVVVKATCLEAARRSFSNWAPGSPLNRISPALMERSRSIVQRTRRLPDRRHLTRWLRVELRSISTTAYDRHLHFRRQVERCGMLDCPHGNSWICARDGSLIPRDKFQGSETAASSVSLLDVGSTWILPPGRTHAVPPSAGFKNGTPGAGSGSKGS